MCEAFVQGCWLFLGFILGWENDVVIAGEKNDAVHLVHNLDFLDDAHLSSGTTKQSCDSRTKLVACDGLFFVRVTRGEGDVGGKKFIWHFSS